MTVLVTRNDRRTYLMRAKTERTAGNAEVSSRPSQSLSMTLKGFLLRLLVMNNHYQKWAMYLRT